MQAAQRTLEARAKEQERIRKARARRRGAR
jgi:hypothetical protein